MFYDTTFGASLWSITVAFSFALCCSPASARHPCVKHLSRVIGSHGMVRTFGAQKINFVCCIPSAIFVCVCTYVCYLYTIQFLWMVLFFSCSMQGTNRGHQSHWPLKICSSSLFKIWLLQSSDLILHTVSVCQKMLL